MTALRIALLTYSTKARGGVVHTLELAEALSRRGHLVDVWSLARGGDTGFFRPVDPAVRVRLVPFPDVPGEDVGGRIQRSIAVLAAAFSAARDAAPDAGYDVVHAQDCISANAVPRCVRTVHHLDRFTTPALVACHDRAVARPTALVCVSASVAREVEAGWGRRATVIANGVDAARFEAAAGDAAAADRALWREQLGDYVLAVGGIEPRKGTLDLVEAFALVRRARPDLRLVVAGGETLFDYRDYRARVEAVAAALGTVPTVLGPVEHARLPSLVAAATVFAFPSTTEGFGLAAMEALAAGVPLVVRDLPVLREVLGGTARYASGAGELGAALVEAATSGAEPGARAAGRALARSLTWEAAAQAHERFYADVVGSGRRRGLS